MFTLKNLYHTFGIVLVICLTGIQAHAFTGQQPADKAALDKVMGLDKQMHGVTFVFVDAGFARQIKHNKVIVLKPVGDDLRINTEDYLHKGHDGPLYIILPDRYAGPKEKLVLKSFPGYHGWKGSMLTPNYVLYTAK